MRFFPTYLSKQPGVLVSQPVPVGSWSYISVAESVLHSCCGADVFVQELFTSLLWNGLCWHAARSLITLKVDTEKQIIKKHVRRSVSFCTLYNCRYSTDRVQVLDWHPTESQVLSPIKYGNVDYYRLMSDRIIFVKIKARVKENHFRKQISVSAWVLQF